MIDTAGTITLAANALKELGATEVYASCTHAVLSGPAIERINNSAITKLVVLDTIEMQKNVKVKKLFNFQLLTCLLMRLFVFTNAVHCHHSLNYIFLQNKSKLVIVGIQSGFRIRLQATRGRFFKKWN